MEHQFKNLDIWKRSVRLATDIFSLTYSFPKEEVFGLTSQIRRCAVSIPSKIAEGSSRKSSKNFAHFLSISNGSLSKLHTQLTIALELAYITQEQYAKPVAELKELNDMIYKFKLNIMSV